MKEERLLEGEVKKILYQNDQNGYTVCLLDGVDGVEYTLTGTLPSLSAGEALKARAALQTHPTYGEQWRVLEFEKSMPLSSDAILR